jgi:two-component system nitrogen regulation sensor histidine kinase NtrY
LRAGGGETRKELVLPRATGSLVVSVQVSPLQGGMGEPLGNLVMVEDLTDLVNAQRAAAWREVARRIAHEIKNPLTPIQLAAQRLRKKFLASASDLEQVVPEATGSIEKEVAGLKNLVDEFSRFARMPDAAPRPVDINEMVRSLAALYEGRSGIRLEVELESGIGTIEADPEQMRRAVINLIENAIQAMDGEGVVTIAVRGGSGSGSLRIEISDTGPGIPQADRDKLFVPYYSNKPSGTGLGLAIVHRIVTEHRGTIHVEDHQPKGARFVIEIPV